MGSYKQPQKDSRELGQEADVKKALVGEIRMITGALVVEGSSKSLKKAYAREVNNIYSR